MSGLVALIVLSGCQRDISGTYVVSDAGSVACLQLVRTPDDHLTGQLIATAIKPDGNIDRTSVALTGAVDGENVTLVGSGLFGLQTATLSGTIDGNTLTLTGAQPQPFILKRASLSVYQAELNELNSRSQAFRAARATAQSQRRAEQAEQTFVNEIDQLVGEMQRFDSKADVHLGKFSEAEKKYRDLTAKMSQDVTRERRLAGNPSAGVARSELVVDANGVTVDTNLLHIDVQSLQSSFDGDVKRIAERLTGFERQCPVAGISPARSDACNRLQSASPSFHQKYNAMVAGLAHLEQVYIQEKTSQQGLLQTAEKLQ